MSICTFVLSKFLSGVGDEMELDINQLSDESDYEIVDVKNFIANRIYDSIEDYIDFKYDPDSVRKLLDRNGKYKLKLMDNSGDTSVSQVIIKVDNEKETYYYDLKGEFKVRQVFQVKHIDEEDVRYLVSEHIVNPFPGCSLIERCYKPYFDDVITARRYYNNCMKSYEVERGASSSGYRITVVSKTEIEESEWYRANMKAVELVGKHNLDMDKYKYLTSMEDVIETIAMDAYDELSLDDQCAINVSIYNTIRPYLDDDTVCQLDDTMDKVGPEDVQSVTDVALTLALVRAKDEETFNEIHKVLGPGVSRIGALTDEIFNNNAYKGFILCSADGELGWFEDCYALNEWEGAKNNPYYGKFMPNENDTLLCFREYHPELIVKELPSQMEFSKYDKMYRAELASQRAVHSELRFTSDCYGTPLAVGDWYQHGLTGTCQHGTEFPIIYNKYEFNEAQCKRLLSGNEIVIDDYVSKMGKFVTIKGKLADNSDPNFGDGPMIEFVRTDVGSKKRIKLNMSFNICEPNFSSSGGI